MTPFVMTFLCVASAIGAAPQSAAVLQMDVTPLSPDSVELSQSLTNSLRGEVERSKRFDEVTVPQLPRQELLAVVDCANDSPQCLKALGESLSVTKLFVGDVQKRQDTIVVSIRVFNVGKGILERRREETFASDADIASRFSILAQKVLALAGDLRVNANVSDVQITVNDLPSGATPLELEGLPEGTYRLVAEKEGYVPWSGEVNVTSDTVAEVGLVLSKEGVSAGPQIVYRDKVVVVEKPSKISAVSGLSWTLVGVGGVSLVFGVVMGVLERQTQSDFDSLELTDPSDAARLRSLKDRGKRQAALANTGIILGAASAAAAVGLIVYEIQHRDGATGSVEGPAVTLAPIPGGGVASYRISF